MKLLFLKSLCLVALASGHRISQLAALIRAPEFLKFNLDFSSVTLATKPGFLAKNERPGHRMSPITIPEWRTGTGVHPLCPVAALRSYIASTSAFTGLSLWVNPVNYKALISSGISKGLRDVVSLADPSSSPRANDFRKISFTLRFFRCFDTEEVRQAGQWSSSFSFTERYLQHFMMDVPCVLGRPQVN